MSKTQNDEISSQTDDGTIPRGMVDRRSGIDVDRDSDAGDGGGVTRSEPTPTAQKKNPGPSVGRRTFVKGLGAAAAASVVVGHPNGMVQESKALAPLVAGGFLAGVAIDWALREYNVYGSEAPPEGLTADVLKQQVYQTALTRQSTNATTIVNNGTILDGVEHTAYTEAKIAAIEALNAGSSESDVLSDATAAIDTYETTIRSNLLKSWNESVSELYSMIDTLESHPDLAAGSLNVIGLSDEASFGNWENPNVNTIDLPDGSTFDVKGPAFFRDGSEGSGIAYWDPTTKKNAYGSYGAGYVVIKSGDGLEYLKYSLWSDIYGKMDTTFQNVRNGISTWVTNVYGDVQSGSIEISDLVTPRERAAMMSDDEGISQALADLIALNIPVDLEREATVFIPESGTTLRGSLGLTDTSDGPIEAGTTYDPSTFAGDVYFTTDVSLLEGEWDAYETGVDGGTVTLTAEPYEGTVYTVETTAPETVNIPATDFTDNGGGTWSYDASGDLETPITEVSAVNYYAESEETNYQTIQLDSSFTVEGFENTETGESADSASFTSSEPQTDNNYITQEEWDSLEQQNQELIDKFEESQSSGDGLFGGGVPWGDLGGAGGVGVLAVGGAVALGAIAILREAIKFYLPGR
ncbi:hypothetical protein [Halorubrum sp. Atlit-26R]|uniref:hypothetical protein n=1 Tax=Halorubrum sp. Atlit-26R TaxID=2282128 RepID=UPI0011C416F3|nr:hypothetical protein [Halorubrum sp. Atlit-26R]